MRHLVLLTLICYICSVRSQVNSGNFRGERNRISPFSSKSDLRVFSPSSHSQSRSRQNSRQISRSTSRQIGDFPSLIAGPRRRRVFSAGGLRQRIRHTAGKLGPAAALRARDDGIVDFSNNGANSILKYNPKPKKPVKASPRIEEINKQVERALNNNSNYPVERVFTRDTAILHCTFDSDIEQIGTFRAAQIWWTKQPSTSTERPVILAAGSQIRIPDDRLRVVTFPDSTFSVLIIRDAISEDAGTYKCSLPSITGTRTVFTRLLVEESPKDSLSISPIENNLKEGETLRLFCQPAGINKNVWWSAKTAKGANIELYPGYDKINGEVLTIPSLTKSHEGVYTCHVEGVAHEPIKQNFNVQVKEKPWTIEGYQNGYKIEPHRAARNAVFGEAVELRCDTGGIPTPYVQWYRNGQPIVNNYKFTAENYEPSFKQNAVISKLVISDFQSYDEASYTCKAYNDIGLKQNIFTVRGQAPPLRSRPSVADDDEDFSRNLGDGSGDEN